MSRARRGTGRLALVTGAAQGLGRAFAVVLARDGWDLVLADLPGKDLTALCADLASAHGVNAWPSETDLSLEEGRRALVEGIAARGRGLGFLVNNMGASRHGYFDLIPTEVLGKIIGANVLGTTLLTHDLVPELAKAAKAPGAPASAILTVSSLSAMRPMPLMAVYAASKAFLLDFGLALRFELKPLRISSTVLCPGGVLTNEDVKRRIAAQGLGGRLSAMEAADVARVAVEGTMRGRAVVVPGVFNKVLRLVSTLIPRLPYAASAYRLWKRAFASSLAVADKGFFELRKAPAARLRPSQDTSKW